jgi:hypothetical protein
MRHNIRVLKANPDAAVRAPNEQQWRSDALEPLCRRTFWSRIRRFHGEGLRLRFSRDPHVCPWCDNAEEIATELAAAKKALKRAPQDRAAHERLRQAQNKAAWLKRHQTALTTQRQWIKDNVLHNLTSKEAIVQLDYVSQSSSSNVNIHDLVIAIQYKEKDEGH